MVIYLSYRIIPAKVDNWWPVSSPMNLPYTFSRIAPLRTARMTIVDEIPEDNRPLKIMKFPKDRCHVKGCKISRRDIFVIGDSGPYVMLTVCTVNKSSSEYAVPTLNRMIMHSVLSWKSLIPVNSNLNASSLGFWWKIESVSSNLCSTKEMIITLNLKQDFILPNKCIIEVRGM